MLHVFREETKKGGAWCGSLCYLE